MSTPVPMDAERPTDENARLAAVRRYEIIDAPPDGTFDQIAEIAATVLDAPIASVSILDADRVWYAACHGLGHVHEREIEPGLSVTAVRDGGPHMVLDATADPRTADHSLVRGDFGLRFYAAAPITTPDGHRLGVVDVMDRSPREAVSDVEITVLERLAALAARLLEIRLAAIHALRTEQGLHPGPGARRRTTRELAEQLRQAAAAHRNRSHPALCQLGGAQDPCHEPAELKVADSWGDSAWGCAKHVEEAVLSVSSVFIASEELGGLASFLAARSGPATQAATGGAATGGDGTSAPA